MLKKLKGAFTPGEYEIPYPVQSQIRKLYFLGIILVILLPFASFFIRAYGGIPFGILIGLSVVFIGYLLKLNVSKHSCLVFEGICTGLEYATIGKTLKFFYVTSEDGDTYMFRNSKSVIPMKEGDRVVVYMKYDTPVYEDPIHKHLRFGSYICFEYYPVIPDKRNEN